MKRISVPVIWMTEVLTSFGLNAEKTNDIIGLFEIVDAGDHDALVIPALSFNDSHLSHEEVLITLSSFWITVIGNSDSFSEQELQALGALRSLYFVAVNLGYPNLAAWIAKYWEETSLLHKTGAVELWR